MNTTRKIPDDEDGEEMSDFIVEDKCEDDGEESYNGEEDDDDDDDDEEDEDEDDEDEDEDENEDEKIEKKNNTVLNNDAIETELDGIQLSNIISTKRVRKPVKRYEDEVFASDEYKKLMLCDIPADEMNAALLDEDFSESEEDEDEDEDEDEYEDEELDEDEETKVKAPNPSKAQQDLKKIENRPLTRQAPKPITPKARPTQKRERKRVKRTK